ncbi:DUF3253 domain-containing protein [Nesterenkonia lutea]|uniref:DUF3253 domain-containing protein n=1 Tax=Nesterenkonia lutea TaxID=272919 RepID=A0ABR9JDJ0_9MICC|nr:DUF3253 domain-containing protein [Nesterenkonia lutea]MBE1523999.1 hypothetical protein [Nesterenkonia lutea]
MDEPDSAISDRDMESAILRLLAKRAESATICPSDAARALGGEKWRDQMDAARAAARRLEAVGVVDITQGGEVVDPATARGPIRIRRRPVVVREVRSNSRFGSVDI